MKRRDFLKLLSVSPIAPGVLAAMPKKELTLAMLTKCKDELDAKRVTDDFVSPLNLDKIGCREFREVLNEDEEYLNRIERLRIEAAHKAANPPIFMNYSSGYAAYLMHADGSIGMIEYKDYYKQ